MPASLRTGTERITILTPYAIFGESAESYILRNSATSQELEAIRGRALPGGTRTTAAGFDAEATRYRTFSSMTMRVCARRFPSCFGNHLEVIEGVVPARTAATRIRSCC